ncbi:hypothetical protein ACHAXH_003861 [Discostella pseudostelligera]
MAGKDADATAGASAEDELLRPSRRRRLTGGGGGGADNTNNSSSLSSSSAASSSGRLSTRLRTLASSPTPTTDNLSEGGAGGDMNIGIGVGRERRSGRMSIPASIKSGSNKDAIEGTMGEEMEFEDTDEVPSRTTTTKKRKKSSILSKEKGDSKGGGEKINTKSTNTNTTKALPQNNDTDGHTSSTAAVVNQQHKNSQPIIKDKRRPLILLGEKPRGMYECDYCGSDITRAPRIRCADCPDFDLCLECFAIEDHHHMAKYKREEEAQRRKEAARIAGLELLDVEMMSASSSCTGVVERGTKKGWREGSRVGGSNSNNNNKGSEKDEDEELGSYVGGIWVPYFRHTPEHRYIVADSTRYVMFPSFRGVKAVAVESVDINQSSENVATDNGNGGEVAMGNGEETTNSRLVDRKNNESLDSPNEKEPVVSEEEQGQPHQEELCNTAMNVDEVTKEDEKAITDMPVEVEPSEIDSPKDIEGTKSSACNESNDKMETSDDVSEPLEAAEDENNAILVVSDAVKNDDGETLPFSDNDSKATSSISNTNVKTSEIANVEATDISCSIIVHGSKSQPRTYRVTDDAKNSWTAEEDLRLLDGILTCGLGNWPDIAEHVNGTNNGEGGGGSNGGGGANGEGGSTSWMKTDKQCMERYLDDFMGRYGYILPPYTMILEAQGECVVDKEGDAKKQAIGALALDNSDGESAGMDTATRKRPRRSVSSSLLGGEDWTPGFKTTKFRAVPTEELEEYTGLWPHLYIPSIEGVKMGDEVGRDLWYRSEQYFIRQISSTTTSDEAEAFRKEFIKRRAQNLPGYEAKVLPPRLEDMKQLPGAELAGYMPRRGEFDMEWDNDAEKTISEMEFTCDDTEADRELKLDVLRIFNAKLDERERRKQFIIDRGLLNYRENQEKMWQMAPDERQLVQRMRIFARYQTREEHEAFVDKIIEAKRLRKEISKLQMYRRMGITSLADAEKYEMDKSRRELHRSAWMKKVEEKRKVAEEAVRVAKEHSTSLGIATPASSQVHAASSQLEAAVKAETNQSLQVWRQFKQSKKELGSESDADIQASKFNLKDKPGFELLTKKEVGLCKRLLLLPQNYLDIKKALISESVAKGIWNPTGGGVQKQNNSIFKVDVTQRDNIIDFVLESGWIHTRPSLHS